MDKESVQNLENEKWIELFKNTDENTQKAAEGLIIKAAFLHAICFELEEAIKKSGAILIHPSKPALQKQVPAVKEYAKISESYSSIVNRLNTLRLKTVMEEDDELNEFE